MPVLRPHDELPKPSGDNDRLILVTAYVVLALTFALLLVYR